MPTSRSRARTISAALIGAFIAARPLLGRGLEAGLRPYLLNGLVAAGLLALYAFLAIGLGTEFYRCEVLRIPNCD